MAGDTTGILVAFDDDALAEDATFTRLDDPTGLRLAAGTTIERGRDPSTQQIATGTATVTFIDREGLLDPTNPFGPFYGKLLPRLQAKIMRWNPVTDTWSTRFKGFTKAWRYSIDPSGNLATCTLELVDAFEYLARLVLTPGDQGHTPPVEAVGDIYFKGGPSEMVHVNNRILTALDDFGWPAGPNWRRIYSGNVYVQDKIYERFSQGLPVLQDAADAEFPWIANFFVSGTERGGYGPGIVIFHGRYARFRPDRPQYDIYFWKIGDGAAASADPDTVPFVDELPFHISDEELYNVVEALPEGINDSDVTDQEVKDDASIARYGRVPLSLENLQTYRGNSPGVPPTTALEETKLFAQFVVDNYAQPRIRVDAITVLSRGVDHPNAAAIWDFLNGAELNDVVSLLTSHRGGGGFAEDFYIDKITETDEPLHNEAMPDLHRVTMQVELTPRAAYGSSPFSDFPDNDEMEAALTLLPSEAGSLTSNNVGFSNDGPEADPGGGDPWDPLREQFFTADDPTSTDWTVSVSSTTTGVGSTLTFTVESGTPTGSSLPPTHNFRTAWFRWATPDDLYLTVEVDIPAAGAAIIVTVDPVPPPSNRDTVVDSADSATAGTLTLHAAVNNSEVWIGVGSYEDDGFDFTIRWSATI